MIKKIFIFLLLINFFTPLFPVKVRAESISADNTAVLKKLLSLNDCITLAVKNNSNLSIAEKRILIANNKIAETRSLVMPQLTGNIKLDTRNNDAGSIFNGRGLVTSDRNIGSAKLSLLVPVYDFGGSSNRYKSVELLAKAAGLEAAKVKLDLKYAVTQGYFQLLESQKVYEVIQKSVAILDNQLKIANDFFEQGLVAANDLMSAKVQLSLRRQELSKAETNILLSQAALNILIGMDINHDIKIIEPPSIPIQNESYEKLVQGIENKRFDLLGFKKRIESLKANYQSVHAGYYPNISLIGDFNYQTNSFLTNKEWLGAALNINIPIFDGSRTSSKLVRIQSEIMEAEDQYRSLLNNITLEVRTAFLELREANKIIPVSEENIALAEENLRIVQDRYGQGIATSADVLAEEQRLVAARSNYFQAFYQYHRSFAKLQSVTGNEIIIN